MRIKNLLLSAILGFSVVLLAAEKVSAERNSYGDSNYGDSDSYGGYGDRDRRDDLDRDRRDIERERDRLDEDRRRLEDERRREREEAVAPPPVAEREHCPSGFSPSENKCSVEERRRGCKDMRLPGGLGCVRR